MRRTAEMSSADRVAANLQQKKSELEDLEGNEEHLPAARHARSIAQTK